MFPSVVSLTRLVRAVMCEQDEEWSGRATSRRGGWPSPARTGPSPSRRPRSEARSPGSWRSRRSRRASSLRTRWRRHEIQTWLRILATTRSLGRDEPGTRPRAYTNFLDATCLTQIRTPRWHKSEFPTLALRNFPLSRRCDMPVSQDLVASIVRESKLLRRGT